MVGKNDNAPIIIKRKKVIAGGGHHGGAWKVAYADFVTAMMAFFLLMWLLNATTEKQRKGIADYFNPTIPVNRISGGGDGVFGGDSIFSADALAYTGTGATNQKPAESDSAEGDTGVSFVESTEGQDGDADQQFTEIESMFRGQTGESNLEDDLLRQIHTRVTDEGLIIEIFDLESSPLFVKGTAIPNEKLELLLAMIAEVVGIVTNDIAVSGHTDITALNGSDAFVLSSIQAEVARQNILAAGVSPERIARVVGNADRNPSRDDADVFRNRRIEITLLRRSPD